MSDRPGMRRTTPGDLAVPLLVVGVAVYVLLRHTYDDLPQLDFLTALPIFALGVIELVLARRVRGAVRHVAAAKPMTAIAIARCVALGKASALVGAGVVGAALGVLVRTVPDAGGIDAAAHDTAVAVVLGVAAIVLTLGGMLLERSGVDPNGGRRDPGEDLRDPRTR